MRRRTEHFNYHQQYHQHYEDCDCHNHFREFHRMHRSFRIMPPLFLLFSILMAYVLFRWAGLKTIGIVIVGLLVFKEIVQVFFLSRLDKRVLKPIEQLQNGFAEIAQGNYEVSIPNDSRSGFEQLIKAFNDMASKLQESERSNREYEENRKNLIANISHDLKTPITSIQGYMEMLLDNELVQPEKKNQYLKTIYNNINYMNKLIDDLFLFSKLDIEKVDFNKETINVQAYMSDLMAEFQFEVEEMEGRFAYTDKIDPEVQVHIDGKRVHQAVKNIIGNAVKYGPKGNLGIQVELSRQDTWVYLAISDNGPGIPEDQLPYIFDRFYRIDQERSKDFMSTGLGLAIARELIEAQGGRILVKSSPETGTCFTVCLPII